VATVAAVMLAGVAFGGVGQLFARSTHALSAFMKRHIAYAPWRPFAGGVVIAAVVGLSSLMGQLSLTSIDVDRYLGLGLPVIVQAFEQPLPLQDFAGKLLFTVASLGTGFKGGEVTPLFYIGATLGNALAPLLDLPFGLLAGLGFVAVFAGAANTPIASTLMAMELFGPGTGVFAAIACAVSYVFSGHTGIYKAQRGSKAGDAGDEVK
jgi:H+/Cl- antiporter ClcA